MYLRNLRTKFQVPSIILSSFRQGGVGILSPPTSKQTPKKPTQIRVKFCVFFFSNVKIMKRAASCKHRQAIKMWEKVVKVLLLFFVKLGKCVEKQLQHIKRWPPAWKVFLSACCYKNKSEIAFLTVTLSCRYQRGFSTEPSHFLSNTNPFYDWVANNLIHF